MSSLRGLMMQGYKTRAIGVGLTAVGLLAMAVLPATANWRSRGAPEGDHVIAESRFGNGTVEGAVRPSSTGYEVQLPSGRWTACRTSCSETLRVMSVDFYERKNTFSPYGDISNECGIFGCLDIGVPR